MVLVKVANDGIEKALKVFKYKVNKTHQNKILLSKKEFIKNPLKGEFRYKKHLILKNLEIL